MAEHWSEMERGTCPWLLELGRFDREEGWSLDGQKSTVTWLRWRTRVARPTAYEKVRVARALLARDGLREAFESGRVTYSAIRSISRLDDPDPDTEQALLRVAEVGSVDDVELAVRTYQAYLLQEMPPEERWARRGFRLGSPVGGLVSLTGTLTETEADEVTVALNTFAEKLWHESHEEVSPGGDDPGTREPDPVAGSRVSPGGDVPAAGQRISRPDALIALVRTAMAHLTDGDGLGSGDQMVVHYVHHDDTDTLTRLDGSPITPSLADTVCCDSARVDHLVTNAGEPLRLGRRTRQWSTAQRRAISVRDGGRCRFPGCEHKMVQIHHVRHWEDGGSTDVDNGTLLCHRHHALHHAGFVIEGRPDGTLRFARPDGTLIGTTRPRSGGCLPL